MYDSDSFRTQAQLFTTLPFALVRLPVCAVIAHIAQILAEEIRLRFLLEPIKHLEGLDLVHNLVGPGQGSIEILLDERAGDAHTVFFEEVEHHLIRPFAICFVDVLRIDELLTKHGVFVFHEGFQGLGFVVDDDELAGLLIFGDHIDDADPECYGVSAPLNKSVVAGVQLSF